MMRDTMSHYLPNALLLFLSALLLSGCGFQLRGSLPTLPEVMTDTYLQGDRNSRVYQESASAIQSSGGRLVEQRTSASAVLILHDERFARRNLSSDTRGRVNAYEHRLQLVFSLADNQGEMLAERQQVEILREQRIDPDNVLAADQEQEILRQEMRRQAIAQMLRRLQLISRP